MAQHPSPTILVVDDYREMTTIVRRQLDGLGLRGARTANDSLVALEMLRQGPVDMVIADWKMGPMSGLELLRAVRSDPSTAEVPFVMISAEASDDRVTRARAAGVSHFLVKPFSTTTLRQCIERLLDWREAGAHRA